ncbi:MAG: response regulator, partial [bacterium]|nr:response regulator [bacterium]
ELLFLPAGIFLAFLNSVMKKILIVDDNEMLLKAWERILSRESCQVTTTANPEEAIRLLKEQGADILISDIVMPKMDGFALVKAAREKEHQLKIVLTTGYVCDFSNIHFDQDLKDLHILMKPYHSIQDVGRFVHKLIEEDESINQDPKSIFGENNIHIHLWNL